MSKLPQSILSLILIACVLSGCTPPATESTLPLAPTDPEALTQATAAIAQADTAIPEPTPTAVLPSATPPPIRATATPQFKIHKSVSQASGEPNPYVLAEQGPYGVGLRTFSATDSSRPARPISISVWYPAKLEEGQASPYGVIGASPDPSGAPYPLLLSSTKIARSFAPTLVSHGFTWASIDGIDTYDSTNPEMLHQPLDILFALEQVASQPPEGMDGMFDAENAGAIGYSFDGFNTLMLSGARVDPQHYLELCADPEKSKQTVGYWFEEWYNCGLSGQWDAFTAEAGEELTASEDGLWQPVTDPRIRAVMPLAADGYYLFGDKGLAAVEVPAMFIVGENDDLYAENALIYQHLGTPPEDKVYLTVLDRDHVSVIYEPATVQRLRHFANAFFGYYLQGKQEYAEYISEEAVNQLEGMVWGLYGEN